MKCLISIFIVYSLAGCIKTRYNHSLLERSNKSRTEASFIIELSQINEFDVEMVRHNTSPHEVRFLKIGVLDTLIVENMDGLRVYHLAMNEGSDSNPTFIDPYGTKKDTIDIYRSLLYDNNDGDFKVYIKSTNINIRSNTVNIKLNRNKYNRPFLTLGKVTGRFINTKDPKNVEIEFFNGLDFDFNMSSIFFEITAFDNDLNLIELSNIPLSSSDFSHWKKQLSTNETIVLSVDLCKHLSNTSYKYYNVLFYIPDDTTFIGVDLNGYPITQEDCKID